MISKVTQLNHRTIEQVLKGMQQVNLLAALTDSPIPGDWIQVIDPAGLKTVYSATREKVSWWPLR